MTAKEMFKKLGYEIDDCTNFKGMAQCINYQVIQPYGNIFKEITFYFDTKEIEWDNVILTMPLLQAINKQVEELGWLDKEEK